MDERLLFFLAGVPALGIAAQWIAWRLRLPSILLLLAFGVALGHFVDPDMLLAEIAAGEASTKTDRSIGPRLLFPIVSISVAVILFEGGLTLRLIELKEVGGALLRLCTIGVLVSWICTGFAAYWLLDLTASMAALIGAILVVTGPTVIAPLLRHVKPRRRIGSIAKWEGIVIDPIGAILAVLVFQIITGEGRSPILTLFHTCAVGCVLGLAAGMLLVQLVKRYWIPDYLHGVVFLAVALGTFALSNAYQRESGLVTVTLLGIYLANQKQVSLQHVVEFKEHLTVLLISCLFIVLGSRLNPTELMSVGAGGIMFVVVMILLVRPASVLLSMIGSEIEPAERVFLSCLAPRGIIAAAVTTVFALEIAHFVDHNSEVTHLEGQAAKLEPIAFLVIVSTVAVYGLLAGPLARKLNLAEANPQGVLFAGAEPWLLKIAKAVHAEGIPVLIIDTNYRNVAAARMDGMSAECASILSEHVREELELGGIGRLLAVTQNDEVNALAVREWTHLFGRKNVYQLTPWDIGSGQRASVSQQFQGRLLFGEQWHHDKIQNVMAHSHVVKKTRLSEEFTYEQFQGMYGEDEIVLFVIDDAKRLIICTDEDTLTPKAGDLLIALVPQENAVQEQANGTDESKS